MPVFESRCISCRCTSEHYYPHSDSPMQPCDHCGGQTFKLISPFNHGLMGNIERRHLDREVEGSERLKDGGHWVVEKNTPDGKPRDRFIQTFQDQRDYCRQEGLENPSDMPTAFSVGEDGKKVNNTCGMPGAWV